MASTLPPSHLPKTPTPKSHLPPFFHSTSPLLLLRPPPKTLTLRLHHLPPPAASAGVVHFEDLVEKDWSFLEPPSPEEEWAPKARRIISAAAIDGDEGRSRVMVSMGSERFVDKLAEFPCELLLAIHDSLFVLAMIKERHDGVRCWQGPIEEVPDKFLPLDAVFVCYFPGMGLSVEALLQGLAGRISPGARVVISFDQGREVVEQVLRKEYPDMVTSDLPDRDSLIDAASTYLFQLVEFVDDPTFYLAVLEFRGS